MKKKDLRREIDATMDFYRSLKTFVDEEDQRSMAKAKELREESRKLGVGGVAESFLMQCVQHNQIDLD